MPALQNTRWELFSLMLSRGLEQKEAYRSAGFNGTNPSILARRPEIRERVQELIQERLEAEGHGIGPSTEHEEALELAMRTGEISAHWVITQLMESARKATEAGQYAAANKALELLGKEAGLFQDKPIDMKEKQEALRIEAERRSKEIPLAGLAQAITHVMADYPNKPKTNTKEDSITMAVPEGQRFKIMPVGPGRGVMKDPIIDVRRVARMRSFPRGPGGISLQRHLWNQEQVDQVNAAVRAAEDEYYDAHPHLERLYAAPLEVKPLEETFGKQ